MSITVERATRQATPVLGSALAHQAARATFVPVNVSPLYQGILERSLAAGFAEAAWILMLPYTGAVVGFHEGHGAVHPLSLTSMTERDAAAAHRRAEASVLSEIAHLPEHWSDDLLPRANALVRRIEALELDRYAAIALPMMIDKMVDAMSEIMAIRFKLAIPAMTALERFDAFVAHYLHGFEADIATLLTGPVTARIRAASGLADLAAAARALGLDSVLSTATAEEALVALAKTPLGDYYLAATVDYLREFGYQQDDADLTASWREQPALALARVQALLASGKDARAVYETALTAAVKMTNAARAVLAGQPGAIRDQFEILLSQARIATALLDDQEFLVERRAAVALRTAFLKLGARLTRIGVLGRAEDIILMTLDEVKNAVSNVPCESAIGMLRVRILDREGARDRRHAAPAGVEVEPLTTGALSAVERAIARLLGGEVVQR